MADIVPDFIGLYFKSFFCTLHIIVAVFAFVLFLFWVRQVRGLRRKVETGLTELSETEFQQAQRRSVRYDDSFDLCASAFVLIGLVGTIFGFFQAVPHLTADSTPGTYDFYEVKTALSVSAMGILWALGLNVTVAAYRIWQVTPLIEKLSDRQAPLDIARAVVNILRQSATEIFPGMGENLKRFSEMNKDLAEALASLSASARETARDYQEIRSGIATTTEKLNDALKSSAALPEKINTELDGLFARYAQQAGEIAEKFDGYPEKIQQELTGALVSQRREMDQAASDFINRLTEKLRGVADGFTGIPETATRDLRAVFEQCNRGLHQTFAAAQETFQRSLDQLSRDFETRVKTIAEGSLKELDSVVDRSQGATEAFRTLAEQAEQTDRRLRQVARRENRSQSPPQEKKSWWNFWK